MFLRPYCRYTCVRCFSGTNVTARSNTIIDQKAASFRAALKNKTARQGNEASKSNPQGENRFASLYKKRPEGRGKRDGDNSKHLPPKRALKFRFDTGTDQAQAAVKDLITRVHKYDTQYRVQFLDPNTNKIRPMHFVDVVNGTNFATEGLLVVGPKEGELPLVRVNKVPDMIRDYTNKLAGIKERELLELGSHTAKRAVSMRAQAEKKKSATKVLTLAWNISVSDLLNQKKNEIFKRVKKEENFVIFVGEKGSLHNARRLAEKEDGFLKLLGTLVTVVETDAEEELTIEQRRREMILERLKEILAEMECKYEVTGGVDTRLALACTPKVGGKNKVVQTDDPELLPKELKRLKKAARQKERVETKKIDEDDLDSLYQLKIE